MKSSSQNVAWGTFFLRKPHELVVLSDWLQPDASANERLRQKEADPHESATLPWANNFLNDRV